MTNRSDSGDPGDPSHGDEGAVGDYPVIDPFSAPPTPDDTLSDSPEPEGQASSAEEKRSRSFWIEVPVLVLVALVIAVVIKTFLVQAFFIPSGSMEATLNINDRILVNKLAFQFDEPHRGDVIVFDLGEKREESFVESVRRNLAEAVRLSAPESDLIKRVVGLPGETLVIRDNSVFIDGVVLDEPYLKAGPPMSDFGPVTVAPDHYFMMGDNRNMSSDSRFSGAVVHDRLVGRAFVIVWPPASWGGL